MPGSELESPKFTTGRSSQQRVRQQVHYCPHWHRDVDAPVSVAFPQVTWNRQEEWLAHLCSQLRLSLCAQCSVGVVVLQL